MIPPPIFLTVIFEGFILKKSNLSICSFINHAFGVESKVSLPNPRSQRLLPMFSSKSFIVLSLTFRSVISFELIFILVLEMD